MIKRSVSLAIATILMSAAFAGGCSQQPAKAPGSNPEDMTPEGHRAAAQAEEQQAAQHEQEKENVPPSKPMTEETQKAQHQQQADEHKDFAQQHEKAAEKAEKSDKK